MRFRVSGATPLHLWFVYFGDPLHTLAHCGAKGSFLAPEVRHVVENGMRQLIRSSLSVLVINTLSRISLGDKDMWTAAVGCMSNVSRRRHSVTDPVSRGSVS